MKDVNKVFGQRNVVCPFFDEVDVMVGTWAAAYPLSSGVQRHLVLLRMTIKWIAHDPS